MFQINGKLTNKINVEDRAVQYGDGIFETIAVKEKLLEFWKEHYQRLLDGCKLMMIDLPYSCEDLCEITIELIKRSGYKEDVYIRPLACLLYTSDAADE